MYKQFIIPLYFALFNIINKLILEVL